MLIGLGVGGGMRVYITFLGLFLVLAASSRAAVEGIPTWLSIVQKGEISGMNWTSQDLLRWKLLFGKASSWTIVDEREGLIASGGK